MIAPSATALVIGTVALGMGTYAFRVAGPLLRARIDLGDRPRAVLSAAAVVLLTGKAVIIPGGP